MTANENINTLLLKLTESFDSSTLIKLTLSNKRNKTGEVNNVFIKPVVIKGQAMLSFVFRYATKDMTKNFGIEEAKEQIEDHLKESFFNADLFTSKADYALLSNKKGNSKLLKKAATSTELPLYRHDNIKKRLINPENNIYLRELGVITAEWKVRSDMQDKFKQINHYVELVDDVLKTARLPENYLIADMGSGKGYLTFALYDHLKNTTPLPFRMIGVELRPALVNSSNEIAAASGFESLSFVPGSIEEAAMSEINVLIALHACDTATDEAIYRGISAKAEVIMVAPCCHKQIRKQINPENALAEITRHGIFEERQSETLTDTIRALILEAYGYKTSVIEFIATEHTPKNVMLTAVRKTDNSVADPLVLKRIEALKTMFGIEFHHLEKLLGI